MKADAQSLTCPRSNTSKLKNPMKKKLSVICLAALFLCSPLLAETSTETAPVENTADPDKAEWLSLPHGIRYQVVNEGDGVAASLWASIYLHYRLTAENGTVLADTYQNWDHGGRAQKFVIGSGILAEALEMVASTMRERDRRVFLIPAELFNIYDFHSHTEGDEHDDEEHERVAAALRPETHLRAEMSLLWVRPYDPSNFNRFRDSTQ